MSTNPWTKGSVKPMPKKKTTAQLRAKKQKIAQLTMLIQSFELSPADSIAIFEDSQSHPRYPISPFDIVKIDVVTEISNSDTSNNDSETKEEKYAIESKANDKQTKIVAQPTTLLKLAAKSHLPLFLHIVNTLIQAKKGDANAAQQVVQWGQAGLKKEDPDSWCTSWSILHQLVDVSPEEDDLRGQGQCSLRARALERILSLYGMEDKRKSYGDLSTLSAMRAVRDTMPEPQMTYGWGKDGKGYSSNNTVPMRDRTNAWFPRHTRWGKAAQTTMAPQNKTLAHMTHDFYIRVPHGRYSVELEYGDPGFPDKYNQIHVNGKLLAKGKAVSSTRYVYSYM